jgi:hypothetical protein
MNTRRLATTGVALVAALSLGVAGCGTNNGTETPAGGASTSASAAAPQDDALNELTAAAQKLNQDTVKMTMAMSGLNASGAMDPAAKNAKMTMEMGDAGQTMKMDVLVMGQDFYLNMTGVPGMSGKWLHLDSSTLPAGSGLDLMPDGDPGGANNMVKGVVDVKKAGDNAFTGTIDLTKAATANKQSLAVLGDKAKAVPFSAKTDEQGRLVELTVDMSAVQSGLTPLKTTYSDFGTPVSVQKPAASEIQEAPEALRKALGG